MASVALHTCAAECCVTNLQVIDALIDTVHLQSLSWVVYLCVIGNAMATIIMNKKYPYQVWLTSISVAPLFLILLVVAIGGQGVNEGIFFLYFYFVFFGAAFSLPALFLFHLASKEFVNMTISDNVKKLLLSFIAIGTMCFTFYIIMGKDAFTTKDDFGITIPVSYVISIMLSTFMYNLRRD